MKLADQIRQFVVDEYVTPARNAGSPHVRIVSGDIHKRMGLEDRMPAVCGAIDAQKFVELAGVSLVSRSGPHQSSTVEWVFRIRQ